MDASATAAMQAALLSRALPYMQRYENKTVVVKYGGHAMGDIELGRAFARDIALLKQSGVNPIVVHGGGPQIGAMLNRMGIESKFEGGLRVTDRKTVEIVEMVLAGSINKEIVALINAEGEWAIGLCGKDGNMVFAEKAHKTFKDPDSNIERVLDLGFVGEPVEVDRTLLDLLARSEMIPVLAPVAPGRDGHTYNINADTFAGAIAGAVQATRLLFLTDVPGVLDKDKNLIDELRRIGRAWKPSLIVGIAGALASFGWFMAMTLQQAAVVKSLAQIEMLFTFASTIFVFKEKINRMEVAGCVMIVAGILVLLALM